MGISEIPQERIRFRKILGIFRKESWQIPQSQGGKRGPSLTLRDVWPPYLDFSGKFSGILREESHKFPKFPVVRGKGGSSLTLGENWPMTSLFWQIRKSFGEYSGKNPWNSPEWGERWVSLTLFGDLITLFWQFRKNFREYSRKNPRNSPESEGERWVSLTRWGNLTTLFWRYFTYHRYHQGANHQQKVWVEVGVRVQWVRVQARAMGLNRVVQGSQDLRWQVH